jgi:ABC-2 type transport system permease protein
MNSTFAEAASGDAATPAARPPARTGTPQTLVTLIRREFWEHRVLWLAPLIVAVLLALLAALGHGDIDYGGGLRAVDDRLTADQRVALFTIVQWALSVPLYVVMLFCVSWYLLDTLYAERKDRSILFWKSLPVSDGLTVVAKLLTALVAAPLVVFVLALAAHLVLFVIFKARVAVGGLPAVLTWSTYEWLRTELVMLVLLFFGALWYAPIAAAMLLASVWARPNPFLWAFLVPIVAPILERIALGTHYLRDFIAYRAFDIWGTLALPHNQIISRHYGMHPVGTLLGDLNYRAALTDLDLWLGVAAAAALVYAAVRIRRYRDDS